MRRDARFCVSFTSIIIALRNIQIPCKYTRPFLYLFSKIIFNLPLRHDITPLQKFGQPQGIAPTNAPYPLSVIRYPLSVLSSYISPPQLFTFQLSLIPFMSLFTSPETNLLPADGIVNYYGKMMSGTQADHYLETLFHSIAWKNDEAFLFGKHIITARKVAWYGDENYPYTYSNTTKFALAWTPELSQLKSLTEELTRSAFNSCLLNLYHTGNEGMAWHSDDEPAIKAHSPIASLSFGAERKFAFKHKQTAQTVSLLLEHGSLLLMQSTTQKHWLHRLPKTTKITAPRINLTFRTIIP
jgi:alkylated DNA repair dioxygenase AlkB